MAPSKRLGLAVSLASKADSPIYFWREYGSQHSYLSQWYPSPFTVSGTSITYTTAEQYMMHQKAILFSDTEVALKILASQSPKEQKSLGRQVSNFDDRIWEENRERIVEEASYWKFKTGKDEGVLKGEGVSLRDRLLATGDREVVEASPRDRIWGVGFGENNAPKRRADWGLNLLGKALVVARTKLREECTGNDGISDKAKEKGENVEDVREGQKKRRRKSED
ncbi:hypothetical protein ONS95_004968 [Cadophora gregata]|uniref:uncharacterized protein n=1 Tax=Cadophora gregata TaxID=51156 RepID=UPI0026DC1A85|nr:uncharacterized protein ONS95_004968 [Cadophora gregata]KAK0104695.1 hypothetical protein ONS95_004968 [Cadophora gregata]KAK0115223.1 hypothetical protein ONS96_013687 [Cadophora gregata f. sp. sojae]